MFALFLVLGGFVCLFGRKLFKPVLFITGVLITTSLVLLIFYSTFLKSNTKAWVGWVVLVCSVLLGLCVGGLFVKLSKLGAFILAGWGGFTLGLLIYNAFLYKINSQGGMWGFLIGMGLLFGILALFFFDHILIHSTALAGAFLFVQAIGSVAGRYQNPFTLAADIQSGAIQHIDPVFYAYMVGTFLMYGFGAFVQYKQKSHDKCTGHDPYHRLR
jgi:MFS family permease